MIARLLAIAALCAGFVALSYAAAPARAPHVTAEKLKAPLPLPYDEAADAKALVAAGIAKAKASGKYLMIDLGGNWCPDCRAFSGVLELPEVAPAIARDFEFVAIDVGRFDKNLDIGDAYGVRVKAAPTVIILDREGKFVNAGNPTALSNARAMTPQSIVDTVYGWIGARTPG